MKTEIIAKNKNKNKYIFGMILVAVLMAVTFTYLFSEFDARAIFDGIKNANHALVTAGIGAVIIYLLCYGLFAKTLLGAFGSKISLLRGFVYAGIDFYYSAITPSASGGQPFVIYYMSKSGIPASQSSFTTMAHTVIYKLVLLLLNAFAMCFAFGTVREAGTAFMILWLIGLLFNLVMIALCILSMVKRGVTLTIAAFVLHLGAKLHIVKDYDTAYSSLCHTLDGYQESAVHLRNNKPLFLKLALTVLVQRTAYFSVAFIVYKAMGLSGHGYFYFLSIQSLIALAVDSLPLPGGIGANEAALVLTLESAFGNPEKAAGGMLLIRAINYYFCLAVCTVAFSVAQLVDAIRRKRS